MLKLENKANGRYYYIYIQKDLFNAICLHIIRGGRHRNVHRLLFCASILEAHKTVERLMLIRLKHGYTLID